MRITAQRDFLLTPLQAVVGVVDRHILQILAHTLFEISDNKLMMTCSDTVFEICASAHLEAGEAQRFMAPTRKLHDLLNKLPDAAVTLDAADSKLRVTCAGSRFTLATLSAADFPKMMAPDSGSAVEVQVPERDLKRLLALVWPVMPKTEHRYFLNGGFLEMSPGALTLTATDGFRLSTATCEIECAQAAHIIVPYRACGELERLLSVSDAPVRMRLLPSQASFAFGSVVVTTAALDGEYPSWRKVMPSELSQRICIDRARLQAALQRAAILADHGARWTISNGSLTIDVRNKPGQDEAIEEIGGVDYFGPPVVTGLNTRYVLDALSAPGDEIELGFYGGAPLPNLQLRITGRNDWTAIIQPMKV